MDKNFPFDEFTDFINTLHMIKTALPLVGKENLSDVFPLQCGLDDLYGTYCFLIGNLADKYYGRYFEILDVTVEHFYFEEMTKYCHLTAEYGKLCGLPLEDNPFYKKALSSNQETVGNISSYSYHYKWHFSTKKSFLNFYTYAEFEAFNWTIIGLTRFFMFFRNSIPDLEKAVEEAKKVRSVAA